jgi:hypothetical protein
MALSVRFHRGRWEVRWRDGEGRKRAWRFADEREAHELDAKMAQLAPAKRARPLGRGHSPGVYSYQTSEGVRWYFSYRRTDGRQTVKRGYRSQRAATAARRRTLHGGPYGDMRFEQYWSEWLGARTADLSTGTWHDYERHGRLRILPQLGQIPMAELGRQQLKRFEQHLTARVDAGELAAKTARNTLVLLRTVLKQLSHPGFDGDFDARFCLVEGEAFGHATSEEVPHGVVGPGDALGVRVGSSDRACR